MIAFRTLGSLDLVDAGGQTLGAVLSGPKRAALLAYLAIARPRGFHRRDVLVALLWPELDQERARAALRHTLHHLRRSLDLRNHPLRSFRRRSGIRGVFGEARVVGDCCQGLIDLVRQCSRKLAHGAEPERTVEGFLVDP